MNQLVDELINANPNWDCWPAGFEYEKRREQALSVYKDVIENIEGEFEFRDDAQDATYCCEINLRTGIVSAPNETNPTHYSIVLFSNFGRYVSLWEEKLNEEKSEVFRRILKNHKFVVVGKKEDEYLEKIGKYYEVMNQLFGYP